MRWEWIIHVITVPILAQFPSNKYIDDVTRGLIVNITTPVDGQIKIDNMFQEKADQAWRPDKKAPGRQSQGKSYNHFFSLEGEISAFYLYL